MYKNPAANHPTVGAYAAALAAGDDTTADRMLDAQKARAVDPNIPRDEQQLDVLAAMGDEYVNQRCRRRS
ncbi:hypothetical protein [Streptomyces harbinensis]|uniref:hypothetical protein n=1 Tax=Streptomyces harbinensis TaxID=1176198 RepID=UPI0036C8354D